MMEQLNSGTTQDEQWFWKQLSPRHLEHRVKIPTAITLHRLVPKPPQAAATTDRPAVGTFKHLKPEEIKQAQTRARRKLLAARLAQDSPSAPPSCSCQNTQASVEDEATGRTGAEALSLQQHHAKLSKSKDRKYIKSGDHQHQEKLTKSRNHKYVKSDDVQNQEKLNKSRGHKYVKSDDVYQGQEKLTKGRDGKSLKYGEPSEQIRARPTLPVHRGMGESNLRIRQVSRLVLQISCSVRELESMQKQTHQQKDFVTPLDNEVQRKRWEEFLHSAGRSLFSMKREVTLLERKPSREQRNKSRYLRVLAASTRTLHQLLLALKTYRDRIFVSAAGRKLFAELLAVTYRVFSLVSSLGIKPPRLSMQVRQEGVEIDRSEDSSSDSFVLVPSDIESDVLSVLQPNKLRETIARLAHQRLKVKRKKSSRKDWRARDAQVKEQPGLPTKAEGRNTYGNNIHRTKRKPQGALITEGRLSPPRRKSSPERISSSSQSSSPVQRESSPERSKKTPQADIQYRMLDGHQLVEDTAEAVVNRLQSLFRQDVKVEKKEEKTDTIVQEEQGQPKATTMTEIIHQLHFLLERACKIEHQHRKAQDLISEVSQRLESKQNNQDFSLETAIQKAKHAMSTLRNSDKHIFLPKAVQESTKGITFSKDGDNIQKIQYSVPNHNLHVNQHIDDFATSIAKEEPEQNFQKTKLIGSSEENWNTVESIADQVKSQKEEFWASLVQRGFVKPHEVTNVGAEDAHQVVEIMLKQTPSPLQDNDVGKNITGENDPEKKSAIVKQGNIRVKRSLASSNVRRQRTLAAALKGDKETQVGSSLEASHSLSFPNESVKSHYSPESSLNYTESSRNTNEKSDSDSSTRSGASEGNESASSSFVDKDESNFSDDNNGFHHSSRHSKDDGSLSFPSYDGVTSNS
ncbi:uncharacterized protein [Panulirus ornatus]|uniref:uncharacterized protein isoform X2 n=1 Tax=Panulirus ornatus TaxID=150431 RepID=UPI003A83E5FF